MSFNIEKRVAKLLKDRQYQSDQYPSQNVLQSSDDRLSMMKTLSNYLSPDPYSVQVQTENMISDCDTNDKHEVLKKANFPKEFLQDVSENIDQQSKDDLVSVKTE